MQVAAKTDSVAKQTPEFRGAEIKCVPHLMHPPIHDVRGHVVHIHEMSCHTSRGGLRRQRRRPRCRRSGCNGQGLRSIIV